MLWSRRAKPRVSSLFHFNCPEIAEAEQSTLTPVTIGTRLNKAVRVFVNS
jgi:hypothetical protein